MRVYPHVPQKLVFGAIKELYDQKGTNEKEKATIIKETLNVVRELMNIDPKETAALIQSFVAHGSFLARL